MGWYLKVLKNYVNFSGRARRKEYWMFVLFNIVISIGLGVVDRLAHLTYGPNGSQGVLGSLYALAVFLPGIAVSVRRLHDIGKSGLNLLFLLIPCIGVILVLIWHATEGNSGSNQYGYDPKSEPEP